MEAPLMAGEEALQVTAVVEDVQAAEVLEENGEVLRARGRIPSIDVFEHAFLSMFRPLEE